MIISTTYKYNMIRFLSIIYLIIGPNNLPLSRNLWCTIISIGRSSGNYLWKWKLHDQTNQTESHPWHKYFDYELMNPLVSFPLKFWCNIYVYMLLDHKYGKLYIQKNKSKFYHTWVSSILQKYLTQFESCNEINRLLSD